MLSSSKACTHKTYIDVSDTAWKHIIYYAGGNFIFLLKTLLEVSCMVQTLFSIYNICIVILSITINKLQQYKNLWHQ